LSSKTIFGIILVLPLLPMLISVCMTPSAGDAGTVYIKPNGDVDPSTAPIQRAGSLYTFAGNVFCEIVIQRDNILVDGAGYSVQGTGNGTGLYISQRSNVMIKNLEIKQFLYGIKLESSSYSNVSNSNASNSNFTNNVVGVEVDGSSNNNIFRNQLTNCSFDVKLYGSSNYNNIFDNNATDSHSDGITLYGTCQYNIVSRNILTNTSDGIALFDSSNNTISANQIAF